LSFHAWLLLFHCLPGVERVNLAAVEEISDLLNANGPLFDEFDWGEISIWSAPFLWWDFWDRVTEDGTTNVWLNKAVRLTSMMKQQGMSLEPFSWEWSRDLGNIEKHLGLLELSVQTGGNPNQLLEYGGYPLQILLYLLAGSRMDSKIPSTSKDLAIKLLARLVQAGTDICCVLVDPNFEEPFTYCCMAQYCIVDDLWTSALEMCGLDALSVRAESHARLNNHRKLRGATRSGVDVEGLKVPLCSGMRHRGVEKNGMYNSMQDRHVRLHLCEKERPWNHTGKDRHAKRARKRAIEAI
jgi:hypothetical protein